MKLKITKHLLLLITLSIVVFITFISVWKMVFVSADDNSKTYKGLHNNLTIKQDLTHKPKYICPMHHQIISDKPGVCSICGMDLVLANEILESSESFDNLEQTENLTSPEHAEHTEHTHSTSTRTESQVNTQDNADKLQSEVTNLKPAGRSDVKLIYEREQLIGIKLATVEKKPIFKTIYAPGRVAFDPELYVAQNEYIEALKQWEKVKDSQLTEVKENTKQMIQSSKIKLKVLGLSEEQIAQLAQNEFRSEGLLIHETGTNNWIYADIFEVDLPYIKRGLRAQITANFLQGKVLNGKVISVDRVINSETRTAKVRIQILDKDSSIRPESYVNVTIFIPLGEHVVVPIEAILNTGRETFVFVKKHHGYFEPRKVTVLFETEDEVAIGSGVIPNEVVVVGGNFMLDSESRIKAVIQKVSNKDIQMHHHN